MDLQLNSSPYLAACYQQPTKCIPVWLMRQAGRYMECYRNLRKDYDFLTLVKTSELACRITLQPVLEFKPDAAIIFADILPLLDAMGLGLRFTQEDGPVLQNPVSHEQDIKSLRKIDASNDLAFTLQAIKLTKHELKAQSIPLIGFSGAPFTLACYAIEGGAVNHSFVKTMSLMHTRPDLWSMLMKKLSEAVADYLLAQINSGVDALQLFDSWAGVLSPNEYEVYALPYICNIVESLNKHRIPITYFSTQTSAYINILNKIPCQVLSIDWRIDLTQAFQQKSNRHALQGNLSPHILLGTEADVRANIRKMLQSLKAVCSDFTGYIFNLGHGIHKETPMKNVHALFEEVRNFN